MSKTKNNVGKFVLGALIGAGLGVLFAPKSGNETRQELKEKIDDLLKKAKEVDLDEVKNDITSKIEEIKVELSELDKEKALEIAKQKAADIKDSCEKLVEYAKDKGTPVLESAANGVREKAIEVTKNVLERLENTDKKTKRK